ncbi:MAG: ABC transporter substrate-binding protein, partial [Methyloceanibacter sp.]
MRIASFLKIFSGLGLLAGLMLAIPVANAADEPGSEEGPPFAKPREGGFMVPIPQSPGLRPVPIGYLREVVEKPQPASRLDVEPKDAGIAGAQMAIEENNAGGRLLGDNYSLDVVTAESPEEALEAAQKLLDSGYNYIVADASAETLVKLADWAKGKDVLFFNIRATDVSLRQENCRANVMHVVPDRFMLADALAQYLITKKWTDWLLVHG